MHSHVLGALLLLSLFVPYCEAGTKVQWGADILVEERFDLVRGKRVGLITNHTGRLSSGKYLVDALRDRGIDVVALFGPEHGIRGMATAGELVHDSIDAATGIRIFSLYGRTKKPTAEMLSGIDVLIYDMQDVGARFYTYISTMTLAMEAAAENGIPFVVLDRPNPLGGRLIDGPVMPDSLKSFVGLLPIPVVYGLTCGELAMMVNGEGWLASGSKVNLTIVPMKGWSRSMIWKETDHEWIPLSPNIPTELTAVVYPATCYIEATNVSEGRGTDRPFETLGAPFIDGNLLASSLNQLGLPGIRFMPIEFTPTSSKFKGEQCHGVRLDVTLQEAFRPVLTGITIIRVIQRHWPDELRFRSNFLAQLLGIPGLEVQFSNGVLPETIQSTWASALENFHRRSSDYHLYGD